jgi:hypothetical protein
MKTNFKNIGFLILMLLNSLVSFGQYNIDKKNIILEIISIKKMINIILLLQVYLPILYQGLDKCIVMKIKEEIVF